MLIVMQTHATPEQIQRVCERVRDMGFVPHPMPGATRTAIGITGNPGPVAPEAFEDLAGIAATIPVTQPYKLVLREIRDEDTIVTVPRPGGGDPVRIGGGAPVIVAGPCAVESYETLLETARAVQAAGAGLLRAGAYKPRTSPYSFQGLGEEGLRILARVREEVNIPIITEAIDVETLPLVEAVADVIQIGARNMQNYSLLRRAGRTRKPVLIKRGMSATLDELLQAAEYVLHEGNYQVILCERGVRTFAHHTRNTLDLAAIPVLKHLTHLPVVADPSHATGARNHVPALACASIASGADGIMVEVHPVPERALSDGAQSLTLQGFASLMPRLRRVAAAVDRPLA